MWRIFSFLDDFQRLGINRFRNHLISTLEGINCIYQIYTQLIYIDKSVSNIDDPISFTGLFFIITCNCRNRITFLVYNIIAFYDSVEQYPLTNLFYFIIA